MISYTYAILTAVLTIGDAMDDSKTRDWKRAVTLVLCAFSAAPSPADDNGIRIGYSEQLTGVAIQAARPSRDATTMRFEAFDRQLEFVLQENRALLKTTGSTPEGVQVYRGRIDGEPDSWARFVVVDGRPRGMYSDGHEVYAVEPAGDETSVYRLADVEIPAGLMRCSHVGHADNAMQLMSAVGESTSRPDVMRALGATEVIDVAVVADFEFTDEFGGDTTAELLSRMNIVDEIFSQQLGIQLTVSHIDTFPAANDPFTDEADPELLLNELADFRADSADHRNAGITHLFTGRSLDGTSVGIAFSEALCSSRFSAGLTELQRNDFFGSTPVDALIAAHELGHNFGAPHDGEIGSPCEAVTENRLMSVNVNGSDQFSACSIAEMQDDIAAASCIRLLIATDVEVEAGTVPIAVDQGAGVQLVFDVNNVGTEIVNNAAIDITIPATVALNSIASTVGSCSSGAGSANCTIGTLASGAGATITLETTAESIGSATFEARVTADDDLVDTNNTVFSSFSIRDPAPPPTPANADDDSGGGSFGWPMLLGLAGLAVSRRRRLP